MRHPAAIAVLAPPGLAGCRRPAAIPPRPVLRPATNRPVHLLRLLRFGDRASGRPGERQPAYTATAELLFLHRNTAQYRVRRAEEVRGRPLEDGRLELELALLACHWLGRAVLQPDGRRP